MGDFFARQRHLIAVRDGVVGALPLVLVGSLFLLVAQLPIASVQAALAPHLPTLLVPYRVLGGLIALYVTFCAAYSLARSYALDPMAAGLIALASYLIAAYPNPTLYPPAAGVPPALPLSRLGAGGIFAGLVLALSTVELTRFLVRRNWTIKLPSSAPEPMVRSFVALIPSFASLTLVFLITQVLRIDLVSLLETAARPLLRATDSPVAVGLVVSIDSALWLLGVHASAALATLRPVWEAMLIENMDSAAAKAPVLPHIAPFPFYFWWVWQGGSGATLSLALVLTQARSTQLRALSRVALLPAICNVNEPLLFGVPVVLNPSLAVPFFLAPLASAGIAFLAFQLDWVTRPFLELPWTMPAPLGAYLSTGGDLRALALQMFNLMLGVVIYWPFVRRYDRRLQRDEASVQARRGDLSSAGQSP